jgi:hypothetical protein
MLWMKAWLETRWRLLYALGLPLAMIVLFATKGLASKADAQRMMVEISFFSVFAAVYLAGAGIRTQSAFQMTKGLHGSTYFTLSLPVSRFRLLAVRAGFGLMETTGLNAIVIGSGLESTPTRASQFDALELVAIHSGHDCLHRLFLLRLCFLGDLPGRDLAYLREHFRRRACMVVCNPAFVAARRKRF